MPKNENRNEKTLASFVEYCRANPSLRFWQALRNWAGVNFIFAGGSHLDLDDVRDTFYWEGRDG